MKRIVIYKNSAKEATWIQNAVFESEEAQDRYQRILEASEIDWKILQMIKFDDTEIYNEQ